MKSLHDKKKLLEALREFPFVERACRKSGIDRATYYRWYKNVKSFREKANEAMRLSRESLNDQCESALVKKINDNDFPAIKFYLQNNNPRYIQKRTVFVEPPKETFRGPYDKCGECGNQPYTPKEIAEIGEAFNKWNDAILGHPMGDDFEGKDEDIA